MTYSRQGYLMKYQIVLFIHVPKDLLLRVLADKVYGHSNILLYNQILVPMLNLLAKLSIEFQLLCRQSFGGKGIFYSICLSILISFHNANTSCILKETSKNNFKPSKQHK